MFQIETVKTGENHAMSLLHMLIKVCVQQQNGVEDVSLQWIVGTLSADKTMSLSLLSQAKHTQGSSHSACI